MRDRTNLTVVINTCDAYADVLGLFFCAFREHWSDCPHAVVINTESPTESPFAIVHSYRSQSGRDDWGARLLSTLSSIDTDFVLMVCDDFVLESAVNNARIQDALSLLRMNPSAAVVYLTDTGLPVDARTSSEGYVVIESRADYRLNSAPGIWRKSALIRYTRPGDNPWAWEVFGTYRTWDDGTVFYSLPPGSVDVFPYNHDKGGAIYRGRWVREVVEIAKRYDPKIDWTRRGFASEHVPEKRSLRWKISFLLIGYRMVGLKAFNFLPGYVRGKMNAH